MALSREQFEGLQPTVEEVVIPELGDVACIRTLTARQRDDYDQSIDDGKRRDIANISARLVAICLCDAGGELLFPDPAEGAKVVGAWPTVVVERLFHACRTLNQMGAAAIEDAAKNSETGPDSSSNTD